jgi:hypothetical protein
MKWLQRINNPNTPVLLAPPSGDEKRYFDSGYGLGFFMGIYDGLLWHIDDDELMSYYQTVEQDTFFKLYLLRIMILL